MRRIAVLVVAVSGIVLSVPGTARHAFPQPPPQVVPRFKAGIELVVLDVSVLDKDRQPVRGLTAADFTVLEDGKPQTIASFSTVDLPDLVEETTEGMAPWLQTVAPDVARNTDINDRRIVVIVMDDATPMPVREVVNAKIGARRVVEALGPAHLACVVYTLNKGLGQEFTLDRGRLLAAVARFNGAIPGTAFFDVFDPAATTSYEAALQTIRGVAEDLAALPDRRKALVLVSVGLPLGIPELDVFSGDGVVGGREISRDLQRSLQALLDAAQRSNVTLCGLDPGGVRAPYSVPSVDPHHPGKPNQDFLKTVSQNTGGFAITDANTPAPDIQQLLRENFVLSSRLRAGERGRAGALPAPRRTGQPGPGSPCARGPGTLNRKRRRRRVPHPRFRVERRRR